MKELTQILLTFFPQKEGKETLPNSFFEVSITMTPKPGKDIIREKQTNILWCPTRFSMTPPTESA